jgi:hypothetical protein
MFFGETNQAILGKMKLAEYLETLVVELQRTPDFRPAPKLVQLVTSNLISDGNYDFPCQFRMRGEHPKKGSFLRLINW